MPTTVLVWNIEMYGARFTNNSPVDTLCRMIRDQLIAAIISQSGAAVVIIQELRKNGIARLPVLIELLNSAGQTDWHFDVVEGALYDNSSKYPDFNDVLFSQSANNEGYAVLWRSGSATLGPITYTVDTQTRNFTQSYGKDSTHYEETNAHVIALVNDGYTFQWAPNGASLGIKLDTLTDSGAGMGNIGFPFSNIPNIVGDAKKDAKILSRAKTRRPVVVSVNTYPVVAYHAPVHLNSSIAGTIAALVAKELYYRTETHAYEVKATRAFAGDLNLKTTGNNQSASAMATNAGLTQTMIDAEGNSPTTMVRPINFQNNQFNDDTYLYTARDYAFGSANTNGAGIYDPIRILCFNNNLANILTSKEGIMDLLFHEQSYIAHLPLPNQPLEGGAWSDVLTKYLGVWVDDVSPADKINICSVFYRVFVSDHIPVQISLP